MTWNNSQTYHWNISKHHISGLATQGFVMSISNENFDTGGTGGAIFGGNQGTVPVKVKKGPSFVPKSETFTHIANKQLSFEIFIENQRFLYLGTISVKDKRKVNPKVNPFVIDLRASK